jgi:hypothetical protein
MINSVRNTVLSILNKNNYGYISPSDFNLFAQQAQMEIYEEYFGQYNNASNAENLRVSGTGYADMKKPISELLEIFMQSDFLVPKLSPNGNLYHTYFLPSVTTVGNQSYLLNKITFYTKKLTNGANTSVNVGQLIDSSASFLSNSIQLFDIVTNASTFKSAFVVNIQNNTTIFLSDDIFTATGEEYFIYASRDYSEAEYVNNTKIDLLTNSFLTAPSLTYPAYTTKGDTLFMYPWSDPAGFLPWYYGAIKADYFRYPKSPKWTFTTLSGGEPVFNQSQPDYQDFELPAEDEYKLVTKICQYCGVSIREMEVTQYAMAQEQSQEPSFTTK